MFRTRTMAIARITLAVALLAAATSAGEAEDGLVAHYAFNEGSGDRLRDLSGNGNDGRISGARFVRSARGFALRFDGKDDSVVIQPSESLKFADAATVEAWVMPMGTGPNEPGIVGGGTDITTHLGFTHYSDGDAYFYVSHGANHCNTKIEQGAWSHLVGTFDGKLLKLYVNGELKTTFESKQAAVNSGDVYFIGRSAHGFFNGLIDEVRLYNRALSAEEVKGSYKGEAVKKSSGGSTVAVEKGLVAYYDFDEGEGNVARDRSGGKAHAKIEGAAFEQAGIGSAVRLNGADSRITAPKGDGLKKIGEKSLSLEAWFKPGAVPLNEAAIVTLAPRNPKRTALNLGSDGKVHFYITMPINRCSFPVKLGEWTHVVGTFDRHVMKLYLNGELKIWTSENKIEEVHGVSVGCGPEGFFNGLIDEVRVYDRALSPEEAFAHYNRGLADMGGKSALMPVGFTYLLQPNRIRVRVDCRLYEPLAKGSELRITLFRHRSRKPLTEANLVDVSRAGVAAYNAVERGVHPRGEFELRKGAVVVWERKRELLPSGTYRLEVALKNAKGATVASQSKQVVLRDRPAWAGSRAGITNKVLPPWTPVRVDAKEETVRVNVWGRVYEFGKGPFPAQIESQGAKLLQGPIRVRAVVDGQEVEWRHQKLDVKRKSPAGVLLAQGSMATDGKLALMSMTAVEYDGTVRTSWGILPAERTTLQKLTVEIPFAPGAAKYHTLDRKKTRGSAAARFNVAVAGYPGCLISNEETGLAWFAETDRNWRPADPAKAVEFVRDGERALLRLNIIGEATVLDPASFKSRDLMYTFGLMATPVKPIERDYWDYRITIPPSYGYGYDCLTEMAGDKPVLDYYAELGARTIMIANWTDILCYNRPVGTSYDLRNLVAECHKRGMKVVVYFGFQMSGIAPEFPLVGKQAVVVPEEVNPDGYAALPDRQPMHRVCLNGPWQDWLADGVGRLMDEYDIDGIYLDTTACVRGEGCANGLHGDGYVRPDGTRAPTYPVFATRRAMRRLYTVVKSRKPDGLVDMHNTQFPAAAWGTGLWQGEGLAYIPRGPFALDVLPMDRFRAKYMARQIGLPGEFLVYGKPWTFQEAYAFCMLHDMPIRSLGTGWLVFNSKLWEIFDEFGRKEAEWLPYWKNGEYVSVSPQGADDKPGAFVSMYRHEKNGVLVVVSNLDRKKHDVTVQLNLERLGLAGKTLSARDALEDKAVALEAGKLTFAAMDSMSWRLIRIRP